LVGEQGGEVAGTLRGDAKAHQLGRQGDLKNASERE
jgi:hypothetical protein